MKSGNPVAPTRPHAVICPDHGVRFAHAFAAFMRNFPLFFSRQPTTPLRVLALVAISTSLRSRALLLTNERRQALVRVMELGALLNNRFDGDPYDPGTVRRILAWFRDSTFRPIVAHYLSQLRKTENNRPLHGDEVGSIKSYREQVNRLSLATLWAIASGTDPVTSAAQLRYQNDLGLHFRIIMLIQLIDDIIDRGRDTRRQLPSFTSPPDADADQLRTIIHGYANHGLTGNLPPRVTLAAFKRIALILIRLTAPRR
jgi:hypothetical protein